MGNGDVIRHLPRVEKDNAGLALGSLLCGSEGTLGLVTAVRLRLVAPPVPAATALVGFSSVATAVEAAAALRRPAPGAEAIEFMVDSGVSLVRSVTGLRAPLAEEYPAYLLVEFGDEEDPVAIASDAVAALAGARDAAVATDSVGRHELWRYREEHTNAVAIAGRAHKFDVTLPLDALAGFVEAITSEVQRVRPEADVWLFGHAGDGNVHVNVTGISDGDDEVGDVVVSAVLSHHGSISAEHGIGRTKRRWLHLARSEADLRAMRAIRSALDPDGVCNPAVAF